eukprot:CAMPEP_0202110036 /NCGR_PEP_ID=MMETSP0965-20130614/25497_1 /ASSEMBLY_ACC=CAM_ASM_000507 /TAXON_ID=4773 /ORGANISM="Schizochytrium aggregatum, Strain ATCC28209" /LENGTH=123 /DNA_ID=CAMNT_0048679423 /DNA_START=219 /DNA_END=588 /DNA_ORIENTATION=+
MSTWRACTVRKARSAATSDEPQVGHAPTEMVDRSSRELAAAQGKLFKLDEADDVHATRFRNVGVRQPERSERGAEGLAEALDTRVCHVRVLRQVEPPQGMRKAGEVCDTPVCDKAAGELDRLE